MLIKVISLSLGSAAGDYYFQGQLANKKIEIRRIGFDGNLKRLKAALAAWDGDIPYIGLGGLNFFYKLGSGSYPLPEAQGLQNILKCSTLVDGNGWKKIWDPLAVQWLVDKGFLSPFDRILCTSALDRWDMCAALEHLGLRVGIGDALFALKLPIIFPNLTSFGAVGRLTLPFLRRLPVAHLYPLGEQQERQRPLWPSLVNTYNVYLGDTHFLATYGPREYRHKTVIVSTINSTLLQRLHRAQVKCVISLQPVLGKRVFGANVWEALALSVAGDIETFINLYQPEPSILLNT